MKFFMCTTMKHNSDMRDLGVQLDDELSMVQHVSSVTRTCFYHIRRLRQIRRYVGEDAAVQLVLAIITSRLDYCNSVLAGLPATMTAPLQRVQNAAARLVRLQPAASRSRHTSPTATALAADTGANYLQVVRLDVSSA